MGAHGEKRSVHFTSRLGLLALQRHHGLGSVNDRNVSSRDSVNERLEVRCGQAGPPEAFFLDMDPIFSFLTCSFSLVSVSSSLLTRNA